MVNAQIKVARIDQGIVPEVYSHYKPEYAFDKTTDPTAWDREQSGLHAAFGSTDELYVRCEVPQLPDESQKWEETAWKGERLNAQILVWSPDTLAQIRVKVNDLADGNGQVLEHKNFRLNMVRYVLSGFSYGATNTDCNVTLNEATYLMPDRFEEFERFALPGGTVRPVWLILDVPENAGTGLYTGNIEIISETQHIPLAISIRVQDCVLPEPEDWTFQLDLWQNPWVVSSYFQVEPWSDEHKMLLKKHLRLYADAGGKFITTYAVFSPWADNSYTIEGTMVDWTKKKDGYWVFNYSIFDQYVTLANEAGVKGPITVYSPVPWGYRFRYMDEQTGNYTYEEWPPDSEQFRKNWSVFLNDLKIHLKEKGWFDNTYLGINENPLEVTLKAIQVIRENDPAWKITYAGGWHPELTPLLNDYCTYIEKEPDQQGMLSRKNTGQTTTFYVCCAPSQPNNFIFSPPVEGRYMGWHAAALGYNGFLRWAYDAWPADPLRDARHTLWPAGDCFLVYPGGNSCIRFEKLREGISDFEKIRILKEKAAKAPGNSKVNALISELDAHMAKVAVVYEKNRGNYKATDLSEALRKGRLLITELSENLGN
jgi:hypothetical protein